MVPKVFDLEKKIADQLSLLKKGFGLSAVKAEFESEGSTFRDLIRLRRLTAQQNIPLFLKIGGVEGLRDLKDALDLGVDGLIAPMVESPFGVFKFISAVESVFGTHKLFKSINLETRESANQIDRILEVAQDKIDNITIGRTDLSQSYFDPAIKPDSPIILDLIERLSCEIESSGLTLTVGGSLTTESISLFQSYKNKLGGRVSSLETRKVILPIEKMLEQGALSESLYLEELCLRYKLECETWLAQVDQQRLAKLKMRL